ncbi:uncharacterized protein LOC111308452 isoform X1 [Durio zibethinus]|uniref:Uncharacterized protein LOC111308452 isoform X1 n=1 Tax=Durio zibethinus TaxID=66656 RepID=A0A6P6ACE0_DURZI|nr:uncharacterized protein LOC111308452 isoform X1 [Durio zibethinus]
MANEIVATSIGSEGHSIVRPLLFVGDNYLYWKTRMGLFIQANDYQVWRVIVNGSQISMKMVDGREVIKQESEWDVNDIKMAKLNAKAMHILFCALGPNEYNKVFLYENTKEICDKLVVTHEGTNQVKETKIGMLTHDYELFKMKPDETISEMSNRFTDIINGLKALRKTYSNV